MKNHEFRPKWGFSLHQKWVYTCFLGTVEEENHLGPRQKLYLTSGEPCRYADDTIIYSKTIKNLQKSHSKSSSTTIKKQVVCWYNTRNCVSKINDIIKYVKILLVTLHR